MKKILFLLIIIPGCFVSVNGQNYKLKGLEIYNQQFSNPAFTPPEKLLQTDILAYDFLFFNGYWVNVQSSLPGTRSSLGIGLFGTKYFRSYSSSGRDNSEDNVFGREKSITISYAYSHHINDNTYLNGGIRLSHNFLNFSETANSTILARNSGGLIAGMKFYYYKFYAGITAHTRIYSWDKVENVAGEIVVLPSISFSLSSEIILGYSLGERNLKFDPIIGFRTVNSFNSDRSKPGFYAGANMRFFKLVGMGITIGSQTSLSASVSIRDRISLIVGVFQDEGSTVLAGPDYILGVNPLSYIAQLRLTL